MRRQYALESQRSTRRPAGPLAIAAGAAAWLAAGVALLVLHSRSLEADPYRPGAGLVLLLLGGAQFRIAVGAWRRGLPLAGQLLKAVFLPWLFVGTVACYLASMALGPDPSVAYLFAVGIGAWYTLLVWSVVIQPPVWARLGQFVSRRPARLAGRAVLALAAVGVVAEVSVRVYGLVSGDRLEAAYVARSHTLPPGEAFRGRQVNALGYWGDEFRREPRAGVFRVAVLGDATTLSGTAETNYLARIERSVPGIEVYNFGIPHSGPREYAAQLAYEVAHYQPDLVLTFISVGNDVTHRLPTPGLFDWRGLRLYQLGACSPELPLWGPPPRQLSGPLETATREDYLSEMLPHLAVCRTPIDERMERRWEETFSHLRQIIHHCRGRNIPVAFVVVPGDFQVSPPLWESLRVRAGYKPEELDLELPQRRLAAFAAREQVALVDLLPRLRASPRFPYRHNNPEWNDHGNTIAAEVVGEWLHVRYGPTIAASRGVSWK